ncbi:MAG: hypothetical protein IPK13_19985 [Deltaproteobacteria bacterium]|nr:hypothetical protein [Deltaproteobacteria bacterium]
MRDLDTTSPGAKPNRQRDPRGTEAQRCGLARRQTPPTIEAHRPWSWRRIQAVLFRASFPFMMVLAGGAGATSTGCGGCEPDELGTVFPVLHVDPPIVDFQNVVGGVTRTQEITLSNRGTAILRLDAITIEEDSNASTTNTDDEANGLDSEGEARATFFLDASPPNALSPSGTTTIRIRLTSNLVGAKAGRLSIRSNDPTRPIADVLLRATITEPPSCDDGNACTSDLFDVATETCTYAFADGDPCAPADRCILNATCSQGVCLGASRVCDDGSPCTKDVCRQSDGECLFLADDSACDDTNPCTTDRCDEEGCHNDPLNSGTPCDDNDSCTFGDACFAGECVGNGLPDGSSCDDHNSCTRDDICLAGICGGTDLIETASEGSIVFRYPLRAWTEDAFLHRREVSLGDDGTFFGLDHLGVTNSDGTSLGFVHAVFSTQQCGTDVYTFEYSPSDGHTTVANVWREMQLSPDNGLRVMVAVRHLPDNGYELESTTYVLDAEGRAQNQRIITEGAEVGRALLGDGSSVYAILLPLESGPTTPEDAEQNLVVVREDALSSILWRHERTASRTAEFLGVAGPRILFWTNGRFGALDFNTGATVWTQETDWVSREMALSTALDLGVARTRTQLIGVEILRGTQVFSFPETSREDYIPMTDPIISNDGRILVMMERLDPVTFASIGLDWVEIDRNGEILSETALPYSFPEERWTTRAPDSYADPNPTVADDGVAYIGYGDRFFAIDPGGHVRWTLTGDEPNTFTGTVPLLRADGIMLISFGDREIVGVRTNGGRMSDQGWASFRHDNRRTNYTP